MSEDWNRRLDDEAGTEGGTGGTGGTRGGGFGAETPRLPGEPGAGQPSGGPVGSGPSPSSGGLPPAGSEVPPPYVPPLGPPQAGYAPPTAPLPGSYAAPSAPLPGTETPPRQGMSPNRKILLIVLGLLGVCCIALAVAVVGGGALIGRTVGNSLSTSPEQAAQVGRSILNYKLPPGYREVSSMNLLGNQMVFITREGQNSLFIMLGKLMAGTAGNEDQFRRQFEDQMGRQMGTSGQGFTQTGTRQLTINGAPTTMTISEGSDRNGRRLRQGVAVFSQGGAAGLLMIMGPVEAWESGDLNVFLDSIR